jgi:hypothetical protein
MHFVVVDVRHVQSKCACEWKLGNAMSQKLARHMCSSSLFELFLDARLSRHVKECMHGHVCNRTAQLFMNKNEGVPDGRGQSRLVTEWQALTP